MYPEATELKTLLDAAQTVVILQADNPDGDSLASALALEHIIGDLGKEPYLYCGIDMPAHLRYLSGWDRVSSELPQSFDLSIIVDTSALSLFERLSASGELPRIKTKPCVVLDHHDVENTLDFATVVINKPVVATGQLLYELAQQLDWPLNSDTKDCLAVSILSDSLGLMTSATSARTIHIIAELVEQGVQLDRLENARRDLMRKSPELVAYKGELLQRVKYYNDDRVATVIIPWAEIEAYSQAYNPSILVMDDMRLTENTAVAVAFKIYKDGKITGKIRCNYGSPVAAQLAAHFGGGGHVYASGFKIQDGRPIDSVVTECVQLATELLDRLADEDSHEAI